MKVIVAGSREGFILENVFDAIKGSGYHITELVSGGARGVDKYGEEYARTKDIPIKQFIPNWDKDGKVAGFWRNEDMAKYSDALVAVWDGKSKGTKHMIETMKKYNKPVYIYRQ